MEKQKQILLFFKLTNQELQIINNTYKQAKCEFLISKMVKNKKSDEFVQTFKGLKSLEITQDFLLQVKNDGKALISGIRIQGIVYIRQISQKNILKKQTSKDRIQINGRGIQLIFNENQQFKIICTSIGVLPDQQILKFIEILSKKGIRKLQFEGKFKGQRILGKGSSATVYQAHKLLDNSKYAIKAFSKIHLNLSQLNKKIFQNQLKLMSEMRHENIAKFYELYETENSYYLILDYLSYYLILELFKFSLADFLVIHGFPSLQAIKFIMINLLQGLEYLHSHNIAHRDIKPQNIMLRQVKKDMFLPVIIDFGLAQKISLNNSRAGNLGLTCCGTPGYIAPELFLPKKEFDKINSKSSDIFSLGVVLYLMLYKKPLFEGQGAREIFQNNKSFVTNFKDHQLGQISQDCFNFLSRLLEINPKKRISAKEALLHNFLKTFQDSFVSENGDKVTNYELKKQTIQEQAKRMI